MISIDGDRFGMTVPRLNKWQKFIKEGVIGDLVLDIDWETTNTLAYLWSPLIDNRRTGEFHIAGTLTSMFGYMKKENGVPKLIFSNSTGPIAWRPVLVPLSEDGKFFDHAALQSTPDGTITYGGTLYVDGQPQKPDSSMMVKSEDIHLGDTYDLEHQLAWDVFGGRLICADILCHIDIPLFHLVPLIEWLEEGAE